MDDIGFEDSGRDEHPTGGLIRRFRRVMRITLLAGCVALLAVTLAGDRFVLSEWLGHIHPLFWLPLVILIPLAWLPRWLSFLAFVLFGVLVLIGVRYEQPNLFRLGQLSAATAAHPEAIRLSFWNVMSFNRGRDLILDGFREDDPDIVCLVEGTYQGAVHDSLSRGLGPDYNWVSVRQMALGSRLPILRSRQLPTRTRLRIFEVRLLTADGPVGVIMVDIPSPPRIDSRPMLQELGAILSTVEKPYILVGDMNTARSSWRLQRATNQLTDFYTAVSTNRWLATWPDAAPLWQIDHAFASPGVHPAFATFDGHGSSNHLRLQIGFHLEETLHRDNDQAFAPEPQ